MIRLVQPCRGHITQRHGAKQSHNGLPHGGQDYAYFSGGQVTDEVFAAADGVVVYAGDARKLGWPNQWYYNPDFDRSDNVDQSAGNVVTIRHNQAGIKFDTTYNHLAAWSVKAGQPVTAGQRIATIGATGFSAGKHLHFELLFHPFNFGTPTYGRADPNPYFVTGLAAMGGTITQSEEDDMSADMPMKSKDGKNVTLEIQLQSIDAKVERAAEATKNLPWFDKQVRERLELDAETAARQEAHIAALTEAVSALAAKQDGVDGAAILAAIEAGMDRFKDSYQVTLQRVEAGK